MRFECVEVVKLVRRESVDSIVHCYSFLFQDTEFQSPLPVSEIVLRSENPTEYTVGQVYELALTVGS